MRKAVERRRQLLATLGGMNARMRRLEAEVDAADNVTRFHMERHVQSLSELLVDVNARAIAMPDEAGAPRQLERDVAAAEDELAAVEAKLVAVRAEGRGDTAAAVRADLRAMAAWVIDQVEGAPDPVGTRGRGREERPLELVRHEGSEVVQRLVATHEQRQAFGEPGVVDPPTQPQGGHVPGVEPS